MPAKNLRSVIAQVYGGGKSVLSSRRFSSCPKCSDGRNDKVEPVKSAARELLFVGFTGLSIGKWIFGGVAGESETKQYIVESIECRTGNHIHIIKPNEMTVVRVDKSQG